MAKFHGEMSGLSGLGPARARRQILPAALSFMAFATTLILSLTAAAATQAADCGGSPAPGLDWRECSKKSLVLQGSNLSGADLGGADFSMTNLSDSNLARANFEKANLMRTWFNGASAEKSNFDHVEAYRSSFANAVANGATFLSAELQRADFSGARLTGASFEKAELGRANFDNATLTGARFSLANLSRADFSSAVFEGPLAFEHAFMFLTRIEGLDLSAATGLEQSQIDLACGDAKTKLPAGLKTPAGWPCPPPE